MRFCLLFTQIFHKFLLVNLCLFICRPAHVSLATLQDLLDAKADPNIADNVGRTALSWAVTNQAGMATGL